MQILAKSMKRPFYKYGIFLDILILIMFSLAFSSVAKTSGGFLKVFPPYLAILIDITFVTIPFLVIFYYDVPPIFRGALAIMIYIAVGIFSDIILPLSTAFQDWILEFTLVLIGCIAIKTVSLKRRRVL